MNKKPVFGNLSLQSKISLSFIVGCTAVMLVLVLALRGLYGDILEEQMAQRRQYEDRLVAQQLVALSDNVNQCGNSLVIDLNLVLGAAGIPGKRPNGEQYAQVRSLWGVLDNCFLMFDSVAQMGVLYLNGELYLKDRNHMQELLPHQQALVGELQARQVDTQGSWCYGLDGLPAAQREGLYYVKTLRDIDTNHKIGYVLLQVESSRLARCFAGRQLDRGISYHVLGPQDQLLAASQWDDAHQQLVGKLLRQAADPAAEQLAGRGRYHYNLSHLTNGWRLLSCVDRQVAGGRIDRVTYRIVLLGGVFLGILYGVILWLARRLARPIAQLSGHMLRFAHSLPQQLPEPQSRDEIGLLIRNFNTMVGQNQALFEQITAQEQQKRHLELALTQAQIKPHFLYNVLDTIYCLNEMGRHSQASQATKLLADYYRLTLNRGAEWISLQQELDSVAQYLQIQQIRYRDTLSYQVAVAEELLYMQIPKLTLQPLVENAIYHGIKPKRAPGSIWISGRMEGEWIYLCIADDGVGMDCQVFDALLGGEGGAQGEGFGLKNVSDRLRLFYGERCHLQLEQRPTGGTAVTICICWGDGEQGGQSCTGCC